MTAAGTRGDGSFVHLHVHTEYSMLDGAARLKDLFAAVTSTASFGHAQYALAGA